ncbi:putative RNA-binding protein [Ordospora colligata]|uniref:Putative RNA-binding protein n=1 Tax=Ordospora colligata OC4 TaxID=1354746 RepID=A0A0B2UKT3_9MICR|nr:putative RNA-binding protein [Ordospora colligata OC4]KHN69978.1 putative RNA-binding protein [Ordospora colligata OC4]TBU16148.1 putative RNA-binding protein [Ordospora colligata]TBU16361.1 putative RNA-binding protein [Ordospora colligata]TBU19065.1 putative RNA-binding protein [Ordospora colligata]
MANSAKQSRNKYIDRSKPHIRKSSNVDTKLAYVSGSKHGKCDDGKYQRQNGNDRKRDIGMHSDETKRLRTGNGSDSARLKIFKMEFDEQMCSIKLECAGTLERVKELFSNPKAITVIERGYLLEYPSKEHALVDMKTNRRPSGKKSELVEEYMNTKFILMNLSYKETEETISEKFSKYGKIEKISIKKNKYNISTGKAIIIFKNKAVIRDEVVMNSKPIYIERVKAPVQNKKRLFLGGLTKKHSIVDIRTILAGAGCKPVDIVVPYGDNKKNKGYGFIEYRDEKEANVFVRKFSSIKSMLGPECYFEYSNEKKLLKK